MRSTRLKHETMVSSLTFFMPLTMFDWAKMVANQDDMGISLCVKPSLRDDNRANLGASLCVRPNCE